MLLISVVACIIGTYSSPPVEEEVLKSFYKTVRPWGFWKPIHDKVVADDPSFSRNTSFKRDTFNVAICILWQTALVVFPIYLVLMKVTPLLISIGIAIVCSFILKKTWWDKLADE